MHAALENFGEVDRRVSAQWFDDEYQEVCRRSHKSREDWLAHSTQEKLELYRQARRETNRVLRRKKRECLKNEIQEIESHRNAGREDSSSKVSRV